MSHATGVFAAAGAVFGEVLVQTAALDKPQELHPVADSEHGNVSDFQESSGQGDIEGLLCGGHR
ncbi:MAG: hypothetical protein ACI9K5_003984, partial [Gammaproteobacteria bacterium]